jgi:two-component system sensor histidine kinase BaeS
VSDVAHELRTPLTNVRVQIEAARDGIVKADEKFLASIEEDAAALSHLVDDLQQLSLADAGALRLELAEVNVRELVERVAGRDVVVDVADDLVVRADARRIVQVLRNLLANAAAFGRSAITISARREGDLVAITVADDGPGVPAEHAERVFDRFYRVDASRSRATGGSGLGLAIARQFVELHGGTISVSGSAFTFTLPAFINS